MVLDVPQLPGTERAVLRVRDRLHDLFSTHVSNAFRYKDEVGVVATFPYCTVDIYIFALWINVRLHESAHCSTAFPLSSVVVYHHVVLWLLKPPITI